MAKHYTSARSAHVSLFQAGFKEITPKETTIAMLDSVDGLCRIVRAAFERVSTYVEYHHVSNSLYEEQLQRAVRKKVVNQYLELARKVDWPVRRIAEVIEQNIQQELKEGNCPSLMRVPQAANALTNFSRHY